MHKAGLFLIGFLAVTYFLVVVATLLPNRPISAVGLVTLGSTGLLTAQALVDRARRSKDDQPQS